MTDKAQLTDVAGQASLLARDMSKNVGRILAALQTGDITRQRAQHVQAGLALLTGLDQSTRQRRLKAAGEVLFAAQLEAALQDYSQQVGNLLPSIEGLAASALYLAALSEIVAELGNKGHDLRELKYRMDTAVQLVAEIQAADGAARYLAGRLENDQGAVSSVGASGSTSDRHPLDQKASDLLNRVTYLEAAADDCVVILERLKEAADALIADDSSAVQRPAVSRGSQKKRLEASAEKIKAILDKVEDDVAVHAGKNTDILRLFDHDANPTASPVQCGELELGGYEGLKFTSTDPDCDDHTFSVELTALLSNIEKLYAMAQERDVHRAFSKACGLVVAEDTNITDDDLF